MNNDELANASDAEDCLESAFKNLNSLGWDDLRDGVGELFLEIVAKRNELLLDDIRSEKT